MEIKSHLFEIMQFSFLHSVLLFLYISLLLKPNFFQNMKEYLVFSCTVKNTAERIVTVYVIAGGSPLSDVPA